MVKNYKRSLNIYLLLFFLLQLYFIFKSGTTWDDEGLLRGTLRVFEKVRVFFREPDNPFLGDFDYNLEFYGYFALVIIYFLSEIIQNINFVYLAGKIFNSTIVGLDHEIIISRNIALSIYLIIFLYLIYYELEKLIDNRTAFWFVLYLTSIPNFSGHSLFNIKDITFALHLFYVFLYFFNKSHELFDNEKFEIKKLVIFGFVFSLPLLIRINAIAFLVFIPLVFLNKFLVNLRSNKDLIKKLLIFNLKWLTIFILSFVNLIIFSPSSWSNIKNWILLSYETQFNLPWGGDTLTNGIFYSVDIVPWNYLFIWFSHKLPTLVIIFFVLGSFKNIYNSSNFVSTYSLYFILYVLILFLIFKPGVYDEIRQFLFLIPFIVLVFTEFVINLKTRFNFRILVFLFLYLLIPNFQFQEFKYVYYNEFTSLNSITNNKCTEIDGCGKWLSDYWGYSGKEIISKTENYFIKNNVDEEILICRPTNVFNPFINTTNNLVFREDFNSINNKNVFYIVNIHRPMKNYSSCNLPNEINCEVVEKSYIKIFKNNINLSYLQKCGY
jgi:hypothetical protein